MASISTTTALLIGAAVAAAGAGTNAYMSQDAKRDAKKQQDETLAQAKEAANQTKGAIANNAGEVALDSAESLEDQDIKDRTKKNRLRVDRTGLSINSGASAPKSSTGLKI